MRPKCPSVQSKTSHCCAQFYSIFFSPNFEEMLSKKIFSLSLFPPIQSHPLPHHNSLACAFGFCISPIFIIFLTWSFLVCFFSTSVLQRMACGHLLSSSTHFSLMTISRSSPSPIPSYPPSILYDGYYNYNYFRNFFPTKKRKEKKNQQKLLLLFNPPLLSRCATMSGISH